MCKPALCKEMGGGKNGGQVIEMLLKALGINMVGVFLAFCFTSQLSPASKTLQFWSFLES